MWCLHGATCCRQHRGSDQGTSCSTQCQTQPACHRKPQGPHAHWAPRPACAARGIWGWTGHYHYMQHRRPALFNILYIYLYSFKEVLEVALRIASKTPAPRCLVMIWIPVSPGAWLQTQVWHYNSESYRSLILLQASRFSRWEKSISPTNKESSPRSHV